MKNKTIAQEKMVASCIYNKGLTYRKCSDSEYATVIKQTKTPVGVDKRIDVYQRRCVSGRQVPLLT